MKYHKCCVIVTLCCFVLQFNYVTNVKQSKENEYYWGESETFENLTIHFDNLGFRTVCEPEIWKPQFETIRSQLAECLWLDKILVDEHEDEEARKRRDFGLVFGDLKSNYYCRLAKNWIHCKKHMKNQHCLEPDPEVINLQRKTKLKQMLLDDFPTNRKLDVYDWRQMIRPYKVMCELAKVQFHASPFGPYGKSESL